MTNLTNLDPTQSYGDVITCTNGGGGLTNVLQSIQDGFGNASAILLSTTTFQVNGTLNVSGAVNTSSNWNMANGSGMTFAVGSTLNVNGTFQIAGITLAMTNGALVLPSLAADPPILNGSVYYNTVRNIGRICNAGAWADL